MLFFNCENVERIVEEKVFFKEHVPYILVEEETLPLLDEDCSPTNYYVIVKLSETKHEQKIAVAVDTPCEVVDIPLTCQEWNVSMNRLKEREQLLIDLTLAAIDIKFKAKKIHGENVGPLHEYGAFVRGIAHSLEKHVSFSFKQMLLHGLQQVYVLLTNTLKQQHEELVQKDCEMYPEIFSISPSWMYSLDGVFEQIKTLLEEKSE